MSAQAPDEGRHDSTYDGPLRYVRSSLRSEFRLSFQNFERKRSCTGDALVVLVYLLAVRTIISFAGSVDPEPHSYAVDMNPFVESPYWNQDTS